MLKANVKNKSYLIDFEANSVVKGSINEDAFNLDVHTVNDFTYHILKNFKSYNVEILSVNKVEKKVAVKVNGKIHEVELKDKFDLLLEQMGMSDLAHVKVSEAKAPMPGLVLNVHVKEGQAILKGDALLVLEAMKMENIIKSPADGTIKKIGCKIGTAVEKNEVLIEFE